MGYNIADAEKFKFAINLLQESLQKPARETIFVGDNLVTWNRNLSFLRDSFYINLLEDESISTTEKSNIWRTYTLLYFAEKALNLEGDFLELGCYIGTTAEIVLKKCALNNYNKKYFLYDSFKWKEKDQNTKLPELENPNMYKEIKTRFSENHEVEIICGHVPDSFQKAFPEKIAFAHIDMNHPVAEAKALEKILP